MKMIWLLEAPRPYFTTKLGSAYLGDSLKLMRLLRDESVDLVLTGPPYPDAVYPDRKSVPLDKHATWIKPYYEEMRRVLKPDGSLVWWINVKNWRTDTSAWNPYFKAMWTVIREVYPVVEELSSECTCVGRASKTSRFKVYGSLPREITDWYSYMRFLTREGDMVLDPFGGTCTCGVYAERLGRQWMCFEIAEAQLNRAILRFDEVTVGDGITLPKEVLDQIRSQKHEG